MVGHAPVGRQPGVEIEHVAGLAGNRSCQINDLERSGAIDEPETIPTIGAVHSRGESRGFPCTGRPSARGGHLVAVWIGDQVAQVRHNDLAGQHLAEKRRRGHRDLVPGAAIGRDLVFQPIRGNPAGPGRVGAVGQGWSSGAGPARHGGVLDPCGIGQDQGGGSRGGDGRRLPCVALGLGDGIEQGDPLSCDTAPPAGQGRLDAGVQQVGGVRPGRGPVGRRAIRDQADAQRRDRIVIGRVADGQGPGGCVQGDLLGDLRVPGADQVGLVGGRQNVGVVHAVVGEGQGDGEDRGAGADGPVRDVPRGELGAHRGIDRLVGQRRVRHCAADFAGREVDRRHEVLRSVGGIRAGGEDHLEPRQEAARVHRVDVGLPLSQVDRQKQGGLAADEARGGDLLPLHLAPLAGHGRRTGDRFGQGHGGGRRQGDAAGIEGADGGLTEPVGIDRVHPDLVDGRHRRLEDGGAAGDLHRRPGAISSLDVGLVAGGPGGRGPGG